MPEIIKVNVVSYGWLKPGQVVVGNTASGGRYIKYDAATATTGIQLGIDRNFTMWDVPLPRLENGESMFYGTGLTTWNTDLPSLKDGQSMFNSSYITAFSARLPKLENGHHLVSSTRLENFACEDLGTQGAGLNATSMFYNCGKLRTVAADFSKLVNGTNMFLNSAISTESALNVLRTIPDRSTAGLGAANLHLGRRTYYSASEDMAAMLGTTVPIAAGTYSYKGWTVTIDS